jgi:DNA-binding transcriptional LysR family regulator
VIAHLLEKNGLRETDLQEVAQLGSHEAVKEAVKAGVGLAMLSRRSVAGELERGTLVELPLRDFPGERPFYLVTRKQRALEPSALAFVTHLLAEAARDGQPNPSETRPPTR